MGRAKVFSRLKKYPQKQDYPSFEHPPHIRVKSYEKIEAPTE